MNNADIMHVSIIRRIERHIARYEHDRQEAGKALFPVSGTIACHDAAIEALEALKEELEEE